MAIEIERKFLVIDEKLVLPEKGKKVIQGYLSTSGSCTVRIRKADDKGFITIKGKTSESMMSRYEWEKEIPVHDAEELLQLCGSGILNKTRYDIYYMGHKFEVDIFHGENEGLIVAEIELKNESDFFEKPEWLGVEVTGDKRYYNSHLTKNPFKNW